MELFGLQVTKLLASWMIMDDLINVIIIISG
jgi:hypothetical protein